MRATDQGGGATPPPDRPASPETMEDGTGTCACPICESYDEHESGGVICGLPACYRGRISGWHEIDGPDGPEYHPVPCSPDQIRDVDAWLGRQDDGPTRRGGLRRWLRTQP